MTRLIIVLGLLVAVLSLATWEQIYISQTFDKMRQETAGIMAAIESIPEKDENYESPSIIKNKIDSLHDYWIGKEPKMCAFTRHIELSYISDALIYAQNFIHFNNKEEACAGLERLAYLIDTYSSIYSINGLNIF